MCIWMKLHSNAGKSMLQADAVRFAFAERDYYARYHDHKENMAWAATVVILGGMSAIVVNKPPGGYVPLWIHIVLFAVSAAGGFAFVVWQFRMREFAADM